MNYQPIAEAMDQFPPNEWVKNTVVMFPASDDQKAGSVNSI